LKEGIPHDRIIFNNLGATEGCEVDIKHPATLEATSVKIDGQGRPFGELMISHCKRSDDKSLMYLLTIGMELCSGDERRGVKGCEIDQIHVHGWEKPYKNALGSTHVHFDCLDLAKHPSHKYCIEKLASAIIKLDEYTTKLCGT
jgi:hypothetical protein